MENVFLALSLLPAETVTVMNCDDLSARIKMLIGSESARSFAHRAGVSPSTLRSILGGHRPNVENLIAIADAGGVSLDWLAKGTGSKFPTPEEGSKNPLGNVSPNTLDEDLLGRVVEGIRQTYKNLGAGISDRDVGRLSARIYSDLSEAYDDPDERAIGLKMALQQLRRDLAKPPSPKADKRSA
jgi:transcriptional regulator with XRE-family HTH domain